MKNKIDLTNLDIEDAKKKSLCALPWVHIHLTPDHNVMPCCIANMENAGDIQSTNDDGIMDWMNKPSMNQMRLDMLAGKQPNACKTCYRQEHSMESFRKTTLREYGDFLPEAFENTNEDGSLAEFKMRYLDIRFSNLCNMKCRTCGSGYSSQWELEDAKDGIQWGLPKTIVNQDLIFEDVKDQIPNLRKAYFAGGEPLITEDHYLLLEEMIRTGRTDIILSYNTNLSKLKFKDKDLMHLWGQFDNKVQVYGSLDHFGSKAEYIRTGTKWNEIMANYKTLLEAENVELSITTSVSVFNYASLIEFFDYLIDQNLAPWIEPNRGAWQLNPVYGPEPLSFQNLPMEFKQQIAAKHKEYGAKLLKLDPRTIMFGQVTLLIRQLRELSELAETANQWDKHKDAFKKEVNKIDNRRGEDFVSVFPELASLINDQ